MHRTYFGRSDRSSERRSMKPTYPSPRLLSFGFARKLVADAWPHLQPTAMSFAIITHVLIASPPPITNERSDPASGCRQPRRSERGRRVAAPGLRRAATSRRGLSRPGAAGTHAATDRPGPRGFLASRRHECGCPVACRRHFLATAALAMRHILIENAAARSATSAAANGIASIWSITPTRASARRRKSLPWMRR